MYRLQPNISLCLADIDFFYLQGVVKEASSSYMPPLLIRAPSAASPGAAIEGTATTHADTKGTPE